MGAHKKLQIQIFLQQIDLFDDVEQREKMRKMDTAVDEVRRRFGYFAVQRGLMYQDRVLSSVDAESTHTVHPHGYF